MFSIYKAFRWYARQDLNLQPLGSKSTTYRCGARTYDAVRAPVRAHADSGCNGKARRKVELDRLRAHRLL